MSDIMNEIDNHYQVVLRLHGREAAERYRANAEAIVRIGRKPSAPLVDSALKMANTEVARVAFASGGACQVREFDQIGE